MLTQSTVSLKSCRKLLRLRLSSSAYRPSETVFSKSIRKQFFSATPDPNRPQSQTGATPPIATRCRPADRQEHAFVAPDRVLTMLNLTFMPSRHVMSSSPMLKAFTADFLIRLVELVPEDKHADLACVSPLLTRFVHRYAPRYCSELQIRQDAVFLKAESDAESEEYDLSKRLRCTIIEDRLGLVQAPPGLVTKLTHSGICLKNSTLYARDCTFTPHDIRTLLTRTNPRFISFTECRMTEPFSFLELWRLCGSSFKALFIDIANLTFEPDFERRLADYTCWQHSVSSIELFNIPKDTDLNLLFSAVYKSNSSPLPTLTLHIAETVKMQLLEEAARPIQEIYKMVGQRDLLIMSGRGRDMTKIKGF